MNTLVQKGGRNSKSFEIQEDGILVKDNFAKEIREYKVYFTDIHDDESVIRKSKDLVLIAIVISVLFNGILLNIVINESYNLSASTGTFVFIAVMIPVFVIVTLCNNEFRKENSKTLSAAKPLNFFLHEKGNS